MQQFWLVVGTKTNWDIAFETKNVWGLKDTGAQKCLWELLQTGDGLLFYVSKPVGGVVGFGTVTAKFKQTEPLWPEEIKAGRVIYPLRFEFDVEHCLPPSLWGSGRYTSEFLERFRRQLFVAVPFPEVEAARAALGLRSLNLAASALPVLQLPSPGVTAPDHDETKAQLAEIGRLQGYIAQEEYPLESTRLDVVWRRVERSVPTFVYEVQVGGDIYHALAKLKHAFDLWNSHIFLVAPLSEKSKYQELLAGTFHEIADHIRFIEVALIQDLLRKKIDYRDMERELGIFKK